MSLTISNQTLNKGLNVHLESGEVVIGASLDRKQGLLEDLQPIVDRNVRTTRRLRIDGATCKFGVRSRAVQFSKQHLGSSDHCVAKCDNR